MSRINQYELELDTLPELGPAPDRLRDVDDEAKQALQRMHYGFDIACQRCGSDAVGVGSDVGYSEMSGVWGGVFLHCASCGLEVEVWGT